MDNMKLMKLLKRASKKKVEGMKPVKFREDIKPCEAWQ